MTFEQLGKEASTYVNKYGTVFTSYPETDNILVTCNIDDDTLMELIKPARKLEDIFKSPDRIDIAELYDYLHPCMIVGLSNELITTVEINAS